MKPRRSILLCFCFLACLKSVVNEKVNEETNQETNQELKKHFSPQLMPDLLESNLLLSENEPADAYEIIETPSELSEEFLEKLSKESTEALLRDSSSRQSKSIEQYESIEQLSNEPSEVASREDATQQSVEGTLNESSNKSTTQDENYDLQKAASSLAARSDVKSNSINKQNHKESKCEKYDYDCEGCLSIENCIYCWAENACVLQQQHQDYSSIDTQLFKQSNESTSDNHRLTELEASRLNNNTILIQRMGTVKNHTCPKFNTLKNISASSCSVNELTLLWLMFTSVILCVIVLFGCLFYCCVFRKPSQMIIIASNKDNFVLIDEQSN